MTYLPQLRDQLVATGAERRRRIGRPFVLLATALATTGAAAGALAATGVIPIGKPVKPVYDNFTGHDPERGAGALVPGSARLLPLRVPDPAGGPPWGMRVVGTTRGVGCVQVGRVVDGRLGVLGQDGIGGDDGRFHALPTSAVDLSNCQPLDGAGRLFIAVTAIGFLASGPSDLQRTCLDPGARADADDPIQVRCPPEDERTLLYGLLGPEARSITYRDGSHLRTVDVSGPDGAYLVVTRSDARSTGMFPGVTPVIAPAERGDTPLRRVTYRDGSACPNPDAEPAITVCPRFGYTRPPALTDAEVARPLDVRRSHVRMYGARRLKLRVGFNAPVATTGAGSYYQLWIDLPRTGRCRSLGVASVNTDRDVAANATVRLTTTVPAQCRGRVRGEVRLVTPATSRSGMLPGSPDAGPLVGAFTVRSP